jgi:hypothetical protein
MFASLTPGILAFGSKAERPEPITDPGSRRILAPETDAGGGQPDTHPFGRTVATPLTLGLRASLCNQGRGFRTRPALPGAGGAASGGRSSWTMAQSLPHRQDLSARLMVVMTLRNRWTVLNSEVACSWKRLLLRGSRNLGFCGLIKSKSFTGSRGSTSPTLARVETVHRFVSHPRSWCCTRLRSWKRSSLSVGASQPATQARRSKGLGRVQCLLVQ